MNATPAPLSPALSQSWPGLFRKVVILAALAASGLAGPAEAANPWDTSPLGSFARHEQFSRELAQRRQGPAPVIRRAPDAPATRSAPVSFAVHDGRVAPVMVRASQIADRDALSRSTLKCWRFVKTALLKAGSVESYPQTVYAKEAGRELVQNYGFVKLAVRNPSRAPVGSVLVYGGRGAGHVELRTTTGYVSDYRSRRPAGLPFIGAFAKVAARTAQATSDFTPRS